MQTSSLNVVKNEEGRQQKHFPPLKQEPQAKAI